MRILKYIILLLLLIFIGLFVFLSTQDNRFDVEKRIYIKFNKDLIYNYLNDFKNWQQWNTWDQEGNLQNITYSDTTSGISSSYSWSEGKVTSVFSNPSDSLTQKTIFNQYDFVSQMKMKDTIGGTILIWKVNGTLGFKDKILAHLNGGNNTKFEQILTKNLNNLNAVLNQELNIYTINIDKIVAIPNRFFISQNMDVNNDDFSSTVNSSINKLYKFLNNSNTLPGGSPFIKYNSISGTKKNISICIPIKEEIFIAEDSDIFVGNIEGYSALKVILTGDYSHRSEAIIKANEYIAQNNLSVDIEKKIIDIYKESYATGKSPSQYITEILIPISVIPVSSPISRDSLIITNP